MLKWTLNRMVEHGLDSPDSGQVCVVFRNHLGSPHLQQFYYLEAAY
jgi:hypothetical protein